MLVAQPAQGRQKLLWWKVDAAPRLYRLDEHCADALTPQNPMDGPFDSGQVTGLRGELNKMAEFAKLVLKRAAKKIAVRHVERTVTEPVIRTGERDDTVPARGEHGRFKRGFHGFKARITENDLATNRVQDPGSGIWRFGPAFKCDPA